MGEGRFLARAGPLGGVARAGPLGGVARAGPLEFLTGRRLSHLLLFFPSVITASCALVVWV